MVLNMTQDFPLAQPRRQQSPISSPARTPGNSQDLTDDINAPFPIMNHETLTEPYNSDQNNQADFEREVAEGIMRLMMNLRAWAEARPAHEAAQEKERLISEIQQIENREREQGTSIPSFWGALASSIALQLAVFLNPYLESVRQRLVGFVASVKSALENLQG
ncbi:unnamed protein product [Rhizoctonia solani]|uniref:Uncharacterized protein n=1 Tax=Rhizoctonia solani TaxID=456999 RepID=A0A8H2XKI1_9AGAM|nr:unnamed protein product [Rhizoctonia solani]